MRKMSHCFYNFFVLKRDLHAAIAAIAAFAAIAATFAAAGDPEKLNFW